MCHDGNSAPLSVRYLNSQLTTLWQNAVQCTNESKNNALDVVSQGYEKSKHTRALAQFHYFGPRAPTAPHSTGDFFFYARFGQPDLKFICNHEAILSFTIDKANLNLDFGKSSITGAHVDHQMNKDVQDIQVTFRIPFYRHDAKTADSTLRVRPFNHLIRLTILDLESAHFVTVKSGVSLSVDVERALKFYLAKYLNFLHQGGIDIFYDVPHTDDVQIDYTLQAEALGKMEVLGKTQLYTGLKVHSVDARSVNEYLSWVWQNAVRLGRPSDPLSICLAEISSNWVPKRVINDNFFIRFGAPEVKALCPHEIVMSFHVEDIAWFESNAFTVPKNVYHNWVISFVMKTVEEKEGSTTRIKAKFETARYSALHSKRAETDSLSAHYSDLLVKFLQGNYFDVLIRYSLQIIYVSGDRLEYVSTIHPTYKAGIAPSDDQIVAWTKHLQSLNFYGFDEITALSEESVNLMLHSLWSEESHRHTDNLLAHWAIDCFKASFEAPIVRLLSNGKAIVWITAKTSEVEVVKESLRKNFWTWPLPAKPLTGDNVERYTLTEPTSFAFEVDLKMADDIALVVGDIWRQKFYNSDVWTRFKEQRDWHIFKHLYFDFRNAKYVPELSTLTGFGKGRESLTRMATVIYSVKDYLSRLAHGGYNIVYSLPIWTNRLQNLGYAATDVKYQVVTKNNIMLQTCGTSRTIYESPVILILAMSNFHAMPNTIVPWHDLWVIWNRNIKVLGSVYLSQDTFLDARLLTLLERINRKTTLLPKFAGVVNGEWTFDINTWEQDVYRKGQQCSWERNAQASNDNYVEYDWDYYDEWSHRHRGTYGAEKNAESTLSCRTANKVIVPTVYHADALNIELKGESKLMVSGKSDLRKWSIQSTANWASTIRVLSGPNGLKVELSHEIKPVLAPVELEGECNINVAALHMKYLPQSVDVSDMLATLRIVLQGQWALYGPGLQRCVVANPTVTRAGGLIMQLCQGTDTETIVSRSIPTAVPNGRPVIQTETVIAPKVVPVVVESGNRYSASVADVLKTIPEYGSVMTSTSTTTVPIAMEAVVPSDNAPVVPIEAPVVVASEKRYSNSISDVLKSISPSTSTEEVTVIETSATSINSNISDKRYSSSVTEVLQSISPEPVPSPAVPETQPSVVEVITTSTINGAPTVTSSRRYAGSIADVLKSISETTEPTTFVTESVASAVINGTPVPNGTPIVVPNGTSVVVVSDKRYSNSVAEVLKSVSQQNTPVTEHVANGTPIFVANGAPVVAVSDKKYSTSIADVLNSISTSATEYSGSQNGDVVSESGSWSSVQTMSTPGLYFWQPAGASRR